MFLSNSFGRNATQADMFNDIENGIEWSAGNFVEWKPGDIVTWK